MGIRRWRMESTTQYGFGMNINLIRQMMKKFFLIMAASILIFACSKEEGTSIDEPSGQVIELTAVNEPMDGNAITRSRPLYSK